MPKLAKDVTWIDRDGRSRTSFAWRYQDDYDREHIGLDEWERAWFFGEYAETTRESALTKARQRLEARGFDPDLADSLVVHKHP